VRKKEVGTIMGSHCWENIILPGVKFSSQSTENRLQVDFSQPLETLRRKKILGEPLPKKKRTSFTHHPDWLLPASQHHHVFLTKATFDAEQKRLRDLEERRENHLWEDALARRAARRL